MICRFRPDWEVLPDHHPVDMSLPDQWPQPEGMIVIALVIEPPADEGRRRPLCIDRDPACWLRILDMRLPNYDGFDPEPEILAAAGVADDKRKPASPSALAGLIRLTEEQFNRLLQTFSQRQDT